MFLQTNRTLSLLEHSFEYPPLMPFVTENEIETKFIYEQFFQQFSNFYSHCRRAGKVISYSQTERFPGVVLNLESKNICWIRKDDGEHYKIISFEMRICKKMICYPYYSKDQYFNFTFEKLTGRCVESYRLEEPNSIPLKAIPFAYMSGNEVDRITIAESEKVDPHFWSEWKNSDLKAITTYREVIYPLFEWAIYEAFDKLNHPLCIADLGGGNGELSLRLADYDIVDKVFLIEDNVDSIAVFFNFRCEHCSPEELREKISVHHANLTEPDFLTVFHNTAVDVIILSGVVAQQVLTVEESRELLMKCKTFLAPNGYIFIASHSQKYFSKKDYVEMGFSVLNSTANISRSVLEHWKLEPFYVLTVC